MHHALWNRFIFCRLQGNDCCRRGRMLKHFPGWTYKNLDSMSIIFTQFLTFLIPFVIFNEEIWQCLSSEFSNPACIEVPFIFPTCKNIVKYVYEISCCVKHIWVSIKNCKYIWYLQMSYQQKEDTTVGEKNLLYPVLPKVTKSYSIAVYPTYTILSGNKIFVIRVDLLNLES